MTAPLRDRFGVISRLELYTVEEIKEIVKRSAGLLDVEIDDEGAAEIASRSRGTPRIANRFLKRVRDFAQVKYDGKIDYKVAADALKSMEVDELGLDIIDIRMIKTRILLRTYMSRICCSSVLYQEHREEELRQRLRMTILIFRLRND